MVEVQAAHGKRDGSLRQRLLGRRVQNIICEQYIVHDVIMTSLHSKLVRAHIVFCIIHHLGQFDSISSRKFSRKVTRLSVCT